MTDEQFKKAVEISDRLRDLEDIKKYISPENEHILIYGYKIDNDWNACSKYNLEPILDLLDKHDRMIRKEIDEEIINLKKEIELL